MQRVRLSAYILFALATYGAWTLWAPVYFLFLFPSTIPETTMRHFLLALSATLAAALLWSGLIWRVAVASLTGAQARRRAFAAAALAFLVFMVPALRFLWLLFLEAGPQMAR